MIAKVIRFLILLSILVVLFPYQVSAAGIGASPGKLDFNVHAWGSATKTLYVFNTGDSEAHYKVYVDEEYEDWFDFTPHEFSLLPQASREVPITVSPPFLFPGSYDTYLYIVTVEGSSLSFGIDVGVKVPIHIHISNRLLLVGIGIITALIVALVIFLTRRGVRRKGGEIVQQG